MKDNEIYLSMFDDQDDLFRSDEDIIEEEHTSVNDIAIVGIAVNVGNYQEPEALWEALQRGEDFVREFPDSRAEDIAAFCRYLGKSTGSYGKECFLEHIDLFSPSFFHIPPKDAALIDPAQRLFMMTSWRALEDACLSKKELSGTNTGVFVGYTPSPENYSEILAQSNPEYADRAIPGKVNSIIASRLSYYLNLKGPAIMIDTACSSSLVAIHMACNSIREGECEQAIAGSVKFNFLPIVENCENSVSVTSLDGRTRTFDVDANGTNPGEGVAAVILKPLCKAEKDKNHIYAVIKGSAINQDGASVGITAPNAESQEENIARAWENSGVDPDKISYIEAHGTATKLGDPVELAGIEHAFRRYTDRKQFCAIGSIKANMGHLDCAAGIFSLIKCVLAMEHKVLPPQVNFSSPNREIDYINSPVYINECMAPWVTDGARICGISSFGMSGTNCHMVLQDYDKNTETKECLPMILPLSAKNKSDLQKIAELFNECVRYGSNSLSDCIYSAAIGRSDYEVRAAIVVERAEDLDKLTEQIQAISAQTTERSKQELDSAAAAIVNELMEGNGSDIGKMQILCRLYIEGADVDWRSLYSNLQVKIVSLPGYPMQLERCWEEPRQPILTHKKTENEQLIDTCLISSPTLSVYETMMSEDTHAEVREHIIGEKNVLAGTVYVEMLHCAASKVLETDKLQIDNLVFLAAMIFKKNQTREVQVVLYHKSENEYAATIQSRPVGVDKWDIHAQAQVMALSEDSPAPVDLQSFLNGMTEMPLTDDNSPVDQMVTTGPRWQVEKALWVGSEDAVTMAEIDKEFAYELERYYFYPSMFDAAVNCSSALNGKTFCLPYYYGSLRIYGKMPERIYSHTVKNAKSSSEDGEINVFDVVIFDENGNVIATVSDYAMKKTNEKQKKQFFQWEEPSLHTIKWEKEDSKFRASGLKNQGRTIIIVRPIENYNERLLREIENAADNNIHELILCDWEVRDTGNKHFVAPDDLKGICLYFKDFEKCGISQVIFLAQEYRQAENYEALDAELENMLHCYFNITYALASDKELGNIKINLVVRTEEIGVHPMAMALQGMGKSLLYEYSRLKVCSIFYTSETSVFHIVDEISYNNNDYLVWLKKDDRFVPKIAELGNSHKGRFSLSKNGTYLITGGIGGIGLVIAEYFALLEPDIHLVLASRSRLMPEEKWEEETDGKYIRLCSLRKKVASLKYVSCDISDEAAVTRLAEKLGPVNGIVHAAGLAGGGFVIKRKWEDFRKVLLPKIFGTWNLIQWAKKLEPEFLVLFSSYSTVLPVAGQSDYIGANSFIDACTYYIDEKLPIKVMNWSGWRECGMAFDNGVDMVKTPVEFLTNTEGAELFAKAMEADERQILIGRFNYTELAETMDDYNQVIRFPDYVMTQLRSISNNEKTTKKVYDMIVKGKASPLTPTEKKVSQAWAKILGLQEVDYQDKFLEIGGDSLSATYLQKELNGQFPNTIDITDVFVYPSIQQMSEFIESKMKKEEKVNDNLNSDIERSKDKPVKRKNKPGTGNLNKLLEMLAAGEIDVREAGKLI